MQWKDTNSIEDTAKKLQSGKGRCSMYDFHTLRYMDGA